MTVGDTPEYLWDTGYDGIQGFASRLRNRVSETSTPQSGQSPKGGPKTPPEPQRQFKQLKVYDETPTSRPLPTLQQIRQANLRKILEEEGVDTPCDICGSPHHDYRNCTNEAYRESQDVRQSFTKGRDSEGQCPNCNIPHPGICPCAWCDQPGHIAQDCMAHFAGDSMRARFPKREKVRRTPIKYYECRRCGGSHPFNIYCPNVRDLPVIPGECRSCGTTTHEHANDCQYVARKDNIGLCTYCQAQDHRYADCPQWALDQEAAAREAKRNKKNKRKGKVKIVAGIMTREQESDSTQSPERGEGGVETLSPHKSDGRQGYQRPLHSGYLPIGRSLLNEFFNKLMRSERKQEITKAKLKKVRQQINVQANPQQVQVGGGAIATTPAQAMVAPAGPTAVTPPQATVPRKAQVGRPARILKPKARSPTAAATVAPKKNPPPKPPVTRSKTKNQPTPTPVAATDLEADVTAPVDAEYDTDELAELPTDSDSEAVELVQGEDPAQLEGQ